MSDPEILARIGQYTNFDCICCGETCTHLSLHSDVEPLGGRIRRHPNKQAILRLIAELPELQELNLRKCRIGQLPALKTRSLRSLDLSCNELSAVPESVLQQPELQSLNLGANQLSEIPPLDHLPLQTLKLHKNQLTWLPALGCQLKCLNLYLNPMPDIPDVAYYQPAMELFSYGVARLRVIPSLACWPNLRWLTISATELTAIPDDVCALQQLEGMLLAKNRITQLPNQIGRLSNLRAFTIYRNQVTELPASFYLLPLRRLNLQGNPLDARLAIQKFQGIEFFRS